MRSSLACIFAVLTLITLLNASVDTVLAFIILIITIILGTKFIKSVNSIQQNFCSIYVFIYLFCSHTIVLLFPEFFKLKEDNISHLWLFVHILYIIFFISYLLLQNKKKYVEEKYVVKSVPKKQWKILIITMFGLSFLSYSLGLSKMGTTQEIYLPFHLAGIINYSRLTFIPVIYAFFLTRTRIAQNDKFKKYFIIYLIWLVLETFVRLSRGVLVMNMVELCTIFIMAGTFKVKELSRLLLPIIVAALLLFPIVSSLRSITRDSKVTSKDIAAATQTESKIGETVKESFLRMFSTASFYDRISDNLPNKGFFDFTNAPYIVLLNGSHFFITSEVDQRRLDEGHNSGSTGIIDSLIFGGYGFCYIVFFLSCLSLIWLDSNSLVNKPFIRYILYSVFIWFIRFRSVSFFLDPGVVEQILVSGVLLLFFRLYYKRMRYKRNDSATL
ncbi:MAG: hypothetical protein SPF00_05445 [Candidatus Egerieousia sp.]|nr:hypothetical protein [Candidatus Egerieousia sp.]